MIVVRPASFIDVPGIEKLMMANAVRVTTLPSDRDKLSELINQSTQAFNGELDKGNGEGAANATFLFVMEDVESGAILGVSGLDSCAGAGYPFFHYRMEDLIHASHHLGVNNKIPVLYLSHELTGSTVLRSFAVDEEIRETELFELLARARFMFMAMFRERFSEQVCVEIQGRLDENDDSPFWNSVGKHFFDIDFSTADYYVGVKSKTFIAELMPQHPIYVPLLSEQARAVMNEEHDATTHTCQLLYREGFSKSRYIDIFDGGPVLTANTKDIATVAKLKSKEVKVSELVGGLKYLICNGQLHDFRCAVGNLVDGIGDTVRVDEPVAKALNIEDGDAVGYAAL